MAEKNTSTRPTAKAPTAIVLIEDHAVYRESVCKALEEIAHYRCTGQFSNLEDALEAAGAGLEADIILLDLGLPGMTGLEGIAPLRERLPDARIIILTAFRPRKGFRRAEGRRARLSDQGRHRHPLDQRIGRSGRRRNPSRSADCRHGAEYLPPVAAGARRGKPFRTRMRNPAACRRRPDEAADWQPIGDQLAHGFRPLAPRVRQAARP